jgi:hypothetical protein
MPMSTFVENCLQPTPSTTCARPSRIRQKMHAQIRKKKIPTSRGMKSIGTFLPTYATIDVDPKKLV